MTRCAQLCPPIGSAPRTGTVTDGLTWYSKERTSQRAPGYRFASHVPPTLSCASNACTLCMPASRSFLMSSRPAIPPPPMMATSSSSARDMLRVLRWEVRRGAGWLRVTGPSKQSKKAIRLRSVGRDGASPDANRSAHGPPPIDAHLTGVRVHTSSLCSCRFPSSDP